MDLYLPLVIVEIASAVLVFIVLMFFSAPYGKHSRKGWGPMIGSRWAWMFMELPAVVLMAAVMFIFLRELTPINLVFLFLWEAHYLYRTFLYPIHMKGSRRNFPVLLVSFALLFNCLNGSLNGYFLGTGGAELELSWLYSFPFMAGTILFILGFVIHVRSDAIVRSLRKRGEKGYRIPRRELFKLVSNPNYLGEIVQWWGWALLTFSLAGLAFAIFTTANLLPRAISNHKWYKDNFEDYPEERKVIVPYIF